MKNIKLLSFFVTIVAITAIAINLISPKSNEIADPYIKIDRYKYNELLYRMYAFEHLDTLNLSKYEEAMSDDDKLKIKKYNKSISNIKMYPNVDSTLMYLNDSTIIEGDFGHPFELNASSTNSGTVSSFSNESDRKFYVKLLFSIIFCIAALYIILSKKYPDDSKKWAFSVLTLIAGVWIGSM